MIGENPCKELFVNETQHIELRGHGLHDDGDVYVVTIEPSAAYPKDEVFIAFGDYCIFVRRDDIHNLIDSLMTAVLNMSEQ